MANTGDMSKRCVPAAVGMPTAEACQGKMKALENGNLVPKLFYTQYEFDSALCFGQLVGFVGFFTIHLAN